jgi:hypothetical protein
MKLAVFNTEGEAGQVTSSLRQRVENVLRFTATTIWTIFSCPGIEGIDA